MIWLLLVATALASGIHAGIPVDDRAPAFLGPRTFLDPALGWSAPLVGRPGDYVRVFVGHDEAEASHWVAEQRLGIQRALPSLAGPGDEAWGDPAGLVVFRDGNVGVLVRARGDASTIARAMDAAIVDGPAWPAPPTSTEQDGRWQFHAPGAVWLTIEGGHRVLGQDGVFDQAPRRIVAWDATGRAAVLNP